MALVWKREQSKKAIQERIALNRARNMWRAIWATVSGVGLVLFGYLVYQSQGELLLFWQLLIGGTSINLFFWIGMVGVIMLAREYVEAWFIPIPIAEALEREHKDDTELSQYFSKDALLLIDRSYSQADAWHPWFLLGELLATKRVIHLIRRLGLDESVIQKKYKQNMLDGSASTQASEQLFKSIAFKSLEVAYANRDEQVHVGDIFVAVLIIASPVRDFLIDVGINEEQVTGANSWVHFQRKLLERKRRLAALRLDRSNTWRNQLWTSTVTPLLDSVGRDITSYAGSLTPFVGRQKEFDELYELVAAGNFGVLFVGPLGSGKWRMVEALAQKIVSQQVPPTLADRRVVSLSVAKLLALSSPKNPLKNVAGRLAQEIQRSGNIIIALEDLADIEAAKTDEAGQLIEAVLADTLKSGHVVLLATVNESQLNQLRGPFVASFPRVDVAAMTDAQTLRVLESSVPKIEHEYHQSITYPALHRVVDLSTKFFHDQAQPGKAINLLTTVLSNTTANKDESWITAQHVEQVVADKTGLPVTQLTSQESDVLLNIEDLISERYINQKQAVKVVSAALRRARTELASGKRPIANFLFLGPTGVGKTELARRLSDVYFGGQGNMVRLDMSEYQEPISVRNLIGAPLGTGEGSKGHLVEAIREHPFSVILLDEFEKAHQDVLNIFLQVMEDGRLSAPTGEVYDFTNTLIIATSNAGSQLIQDELQAGKDIERVTERVKEEALPKHFKPELLNRFDAVVVFEPLKFRYIIDIAKLLLGDLAERLKEKEINLEVTDDAIKDIAENGYEPSLGARPLRRVIQDKIEDEIAKLILQKSVRARDTIVIEKDFKLAVKQAKHYS